MCIIIALVVVSPGVGCFEKYTPDQIKMPFVGTSTKPIGYKTIQINKHPYMKLQLDSLKKTQF